jgi:hypothetical protein
VGRWWDDPKAQLLQMLGLGSIIYVFVLTVLLWIVVRPLVAPDWKYFRIATLVMFTSPPALIYAIPVERYVDMDTAIGMNMIFLGVVATWRVSLYFRLLRRVARLDLFTTFITCLLPLMVIVATLFVLNLHRVVFQLMGGLREESPQEGAYMILFALTALSVYGVIPILVSYIVMMVIRRKQSRTANGEEPANEAEHSSR